MKRLFLLLALVFLAVFGFSQSVLWKVTGKKIKSPSYLYGTIHIQDQRVFAFDNTVTDAFNSCEAFAMEVLLDEVSPQEQIQAMTMPDGKTLTDLLTKEDYALLDSVFKAKTGTSVFLYNKMKPFFVSSALTQAEAKKEKEAPLDLYLLSTARKAGKSCYGVEKFIDQIKAIDALTLEEQVEMMMSSLKDTTTDNEDATQEGLAKIVERYLAFDLAKMLEMSSDTALPEQFNKVFLIDRNKGMAKNFIKLAKKQSLFCAVGAAHLPGDLGVINHLRKAGFTVEPVVFKWKE